MPQKIFERLFTLRKQFIFNLSIRQLYGFVLLKSMSNMPSVPFSYAYLLFMQICISCIPMCHKCLFGIRVKILFVSTSKIINKIILEKRPSYKKFNTHVFVVWLVPFLFVCQSIYSKDRWPTQWVLHSLKFYEKLQLIRKTTKQCL